MGMWSRSLCSRAVYRRDAEDILVDLAGANVMFAPFLLRHTFLFLRHGEAGAG
jgi:hypothetical protein